MSATNRGADRARLDYYPTPSWAVRRFLEAAPMPAGRWVEPCAGDGAIIRAVSRADVEWTAIEIRRECRESLDASGATHVIIDDALHDGRRSVTRPRFEVMLTNPPFTLAMEFIEWGFRAANIVAVLLRLNFLASVRRNEFMRRHPPDVFVLPDRPSFTGSGTDSIEYAWFLWPSVRRRQHGRLAVLPATPRTERSRNDSIAATQSNNLASHGPSRRGNAMRRLRQDASDQ